MPSTILIDVELPEPVVFSASVTGLLSSLRIVLLGWYKVPEQTLPEQAREQFEGEAGAALEQTAQQFREAGADVTTRLVFTGSPFETISRISVEESCDAVYGARPASNLQRVLVPLRGAPNFASITRFVRDMVQENTTDVTLMHVLSEDETEADARESVLNPVRRWTEERGIDGGVLSEQIVPSDDPAQTIIDASHDYDLVVLAETEPTIRDILFGSVPKQIARKANVPVIVVRHAADNVPA